MPWTHAGEIICLLKRQLGLNEVFFTVEKVWDKETGINGIEIVGYKKGTIFAQTQSSVAGYELTVRKREIIKKLNQYIGSPEIKNIKIDIK